jgi:hypothetical protein
LKPSPTKLRLGWTQRTEARVLGLCLAREAGLLFAWDASRRLYLWNVTGALVARQSLHFQPGAACISDDGSRVVVVGESGELWWLDHELRLKLDLRIPAGGQVAALDTLGHYLAVSDRERHTRLYHRGGKELALIETPRPLVFLQFLATQPRLLGAADFGFVGAFDPTGHAVWRAAPLFRVGSLCTDGQGSCLLLASYSSGVERYDAGGQHLPHLATPQPCRLARTDFAMSCILIATESSTLALLKPDGAVVKTVPIPGNATGLVLGALGEYGAFALADGTVGFVETG